MTSEEKLSAIISRVPLLDDTFTAEHISVMMITHYMSTLEKAGIIEGGYHMTPLGENVVAVCEEFDWKPTDEHLELFLNEMVEEKTRPAFRHFMREYRDNREAFLAKVKKFMDENKGEN
jgi:hypothetical protein